ncbi:hypothetical protein ABQZ09_06175 [Xanthomonas sp. WHRI 6106]
MHAAHQHDTADIDMDVVHGDSPSTRLRHEAGAGVQSHCGVCRCVVVTPGARLRR